MPFRFYADRFLPRMEEKEWRLSFKFVLMLVLEIMCLANAASKRVSRREVKTSPSKCTYNLVVNQVNASQCPTLLQGAGQGGFQNEQPSILQQTYLRSMEDLMKKVKMLETKLLEEVAESRQLKNDFLLQDQWLKRTDGVIQVQKDHVQQVISHVMELKSVMLRQKVHAQSIDSKLSATMLDVSELHHVMSRVSKQQSDSIHNKHIPVQATSEVLRCGLSDNATKFNDCEEVYHNGHTKTGVYYITPSYASCPIPVYCDMDTPPGGWLVIQRRQDGSVSFKKDWRDYKLGFGDVTGEFWLGNDNIFLLTNQLHYQLRVDLWDFYGSRVYAEYRHFKIDGDRDNYQLHISNHTGTAPDGLSHHDKAYFSTLDRDNDGWSDYHCAQEWVAGWWFNNCWFVILNGQYHNTTEVKYRGISWNDWKTEQLQHVEMKIRPSGY